MSALTKPDEKAIVISYAHAMADLATQLGCDKSKLLKSSGIIEKPPTDFYSFISIAQYKALMQAILDASKNPAAGLRIGKGIEFGHHGTFAYAGLSFPSAWQAIKVGRKLSQLVNRIITLRLVETDDAKIIEFDTPYFSGQMYQSIIEMVMAMFCQLFKFLLDGRVSKLDITFNFNEPAYANEYAEIFEPTVHFNAPANSIRIPKALAEKPLTMANPIVAQQFEDQCDDLLAKTLEKRTSAEQVRDILFMARYEFPSLDEVAAQIYVSPRTLRRHLKEANTSFQKILDSVRSDIAKRYLINSQRSIGEIATLLGYEDQNSFSHAFKVLEGIPPTQFRKKHQHI